MLLVVCGGVSATALLAHFIFDSIRINHCSGHGCTNEILISSQTALTNYVPIGQCQATSLLLARDSRRSVRDKILLVGKKNSVTEYVLPMMHLSAYDPTLTDPSYARQGLSAVKYGYPISIASSSLRLALFNLGLADAIILSPDNITTSIDPMVVKYRFRLQPFNIRLGLPRIARTVGISEDSEVVESYLKRNHSLFDQPAYSCP